MAYAPPSFPYQRAVLLAAHCTLGIGGPARYCVEVHTPQQAQEAVAYAHAHTLPLLVLGKGSNCLVDDTGFDGLVVINRLDTLHAEGPLWRAGSGYSFPRLGVAAARAGWRGLEFAAGIPATVGGAVYMNAGAGGQSTADVLQCVHYLTLEGEIVVLPWAALEFGYRTSSFQQRTGMILEAQFLLHPHAEAAAMQKALLAYRLKTQPYKEKSAGCAFRNPPGHSAGKLIEECGGKGMCVGGAFVSQLHANFIVNAGRATAADVRALMQCIQERVYARTGIVLQEEIRWIPNPGRA